MANLNGFLLIDKPAGLSSFDVIRMLRKQTGIRTFGHAGTLDPFATGLLLIAVNKYTRLLPLWDEADKTYTATLELGKTSTTGDSEGDITSCGGSTVSLEQVESIIHQILAITEMVPHKFSAIKVNGKRAYELARQDEEFELAAREVRIHSYEVVSFAYPHLTYTCRVSKGTYIRSLSEWIASALGTCAYTIALRRIAISGVSVEQALPVSEFTAGNVSEKLVSVRELLPQLEVVDLDTAALAKLRNGNATASAGNDNPVVLLYHEGECTGLGYRQEGMLFPRVNI